MGSVKYVYVLFGNPSSFGKVVNLSRDIDGVVNVEFDNQTNELTLYLREQTSEYDVFCALTSMAETFSVDVDYAAEVEENKNATEPIRVETPPVKEQEEAEEEQEKPEQKAVGEDLPEHEKPWKKRFLGHFIEIALSAVLLLVAGIFNLGENLEMILHLIAFSVVGYEIIWDAVSAVAKKNFFDYSIVMVICAVLTLFLATYEEASILVLLFEVEIVLSKVFGAVATEKLKKRLYFNYSNVTIGGEEEEKQVFASQVDVGAVVRFKKGDVLPFDCEITEGECVVDSFNVSGKHTALTRANGAIVYGGEKIKEGEITVKVKCSVEESFAGRMYSTVNSACDCALNKPLVQKINKYVVLTLLVSVVLAFVAPLLKEGAYSVLLGESAVLAVVFFALSNTLFFSVSKVLGLKSALNRALSLTCIPSSVEDIQKIANVNTVVFDEPGVLKEENIKIDKVYLASSFKGKITKLIKDYSLTLSDVAKKDEISVTVGSNTLYCATYEKIQQSKIAVEKEIEDDGVKYLAINGKYVGAFTLLEGIKRDAYGAIRELKDEGVNSTILTDETEAFESLSKVAKVEGKANNEAINLGENTVYVGNKKANENANVSIVFDSMGKVFKYKNSFVIANGQPKSVAKVIKLFKRLKKFEKNTLIASLIFKAIAFVLSLVLYIVSTLPQVWIPVLISVVVDCICIFIVYKNDFEV